MLCCAETVWRSMRVRRPVLGSRGERHHRVGHIRRGEHGAPVATHGNAVCAANSRHALFAVAQGLDEAQFAARGVAGEDDESVVSVAHRIHVSTVGAERQGAGATQADHATAAVLQRLSRGQAPGVRSAGQRP